MFGRQLDKSVLSRGPPGIGFKTTKDGHYDLEKKRLCNIADPEEDSDAISFNVLTAKSHNIIELLRKEIEENRTQLAQGLETSIKDVINTINIVLQREMDQMKTLQLEKLQSDLPKSIDALRIDLKKVEISMNNMFSQINLRLRNLETRNSRPENYDGQYT